MKTDLKNELVKHPKFGFLQVHPTPSPEEITKFYAEEFYSSKYKSFNNSLLEVQEADKPFHDVHREDIGKNISKYLDRPIEGLTILDIGCGWGQTLRYFSELGAHCFGFDPAPEAVNHVRSLGIECVHAGMERMDVFEGRRFDVVLLMNVLEHLADPVEVINEIYLKILRPGGMLVVEVPNEFNAFQQCGQATHGLSEWWVSPPAHLNYFSASSLAALLQGSGFEVPSMEASFPMEIFLLMNENYVDDSSLGRSCHKKRMAFEENLRKYGHEGALHAFYQALAKLDLGRQVIAYAIGKVS